MFDVNKCFSGYQGFDVETLAIQLHILTDVDGCCLILPKSLHTIQKMTEIQIIVISRSEASNPKAKSPEFPLFKFEKKTNQIISNMGWVGGAGWVGGGAKKPMNPEIVMAPIAQA